MKKLIILLIVLLSANYSFSQNLPEIDFFGGVSFPFGKYSGDELETGSYTDLGGSMAINLNWYFNDHLGLYIGAQQMLHVVDVVSLASAKMWYDPVLKTLTIRSGPYSFLGITSGFKYKKEISPKLNIVGGIGVGIMYAATPNQLHRADFFILGNVIYEITTAKDKNILFNPQLALEYKLKKDWNIILVSDYSISDMSFKFSSTSGVRYENRLIQALNLSLGIKLVL